MKNRFTPEVNPVDYQQYMPTKRRQVTLSPRNRSQQEYLAKLQDESLSIVFAVGPAGTGKTMLAVQNGIKLFQEGKIKKIIVTRPAVSADEDLGFLPGTLEEKMAPWTRPIFDVFSEYYQKRDIARYIDEGIIEISPLAYMRGRAEPLSAIIPTPSGSKTMGDIQVGDVIFGADGKETKVTGVFPQGKTPVADVHFSDGSVVRCSKNHLWNTRSQSQRAKNKEFSTKTTDEIQKSLTNKHGHKNHEIPVVSSPVKFLSKAVSVEPYILGCLLGDGSISCGSIGFSTADPEMIQLIEQRLSHSVSINKNMSSKTGYDYTISRKEGYHKNSLKGLLKELNLWGLTAIDKHIPKDYLQNDESVRLEVLRGLMDTDGSIFYHRSGKTRVQFYSISAQLAADVKWIVESLGGIARIRTRITPKNGTHTTGFGHNHDINVVDITLPQCINPFKLSRKHDLFNPSPLVRLISDIVDVGDEECQCISVSSDDKLYLTNNFIVTHNTFHNAYIVADEIQLATIAQVKMLLTRIGEGSKMVVTGDLAQADRGANNGLYDFIRKIEVMPFLNHIDIAYFGHADIERHAAVREVLKIYGEDQ